MRERMTWEHEPTPRSSVLEQVGAGSQPGPIKISSSFGWRRDPLGGRGRRHSGIDLPGRPGANVYTTGLGRVETAGWVAGYGNLVEIAHANGLRTRYGHLSTILVSPGAQVGAGQVIGKIGSTGRSTGPHLHYEVRVAGVATDPRPFMHGSRIDYLVRWAPEQEAKPKWTGWTDPINSQLPQSVIK
jgi:murein DD-endopeptidase MepM/ murein hydrolase activator NlpD